MRERTLGPEHAEVAGSLNNLAVLLKGMGRYEEAQALYARSIRIKEKALGTAHPQVGCWLGLHPTGWASWLVPPARNGNPTQARSA